MPNIFPLTGIAKHFIPTAPNNFIEGLVDDIVDQVLFVTLEKPVSSYPGLIAANTFVHEFEAETAVKLIDNFHKTKTKRRRVEYFKEVYCRNKIIRDFIRLKPTCFLIMGFPCEKQYEIGQAFAEKLSHVHINVLDLINEEIAKRTDVGMWIYTNLKMKKDIPIKLILKLLTKALKRPDVMYRGYVLTTFPILPFKKFTSDRLPIRFDDMDRLEAPPLEQCEKWMGKRVKVIKYPGGIEEDSLETGEGYYEGSSGGNTSTEASVSDSDEEAFVEEDHVTISTESTASDSEESEVDLDYDLSLHEIINNQRLSNVLDESDFILNVRHQFDTLLKLDLPPDIVVFFPLSDEDNVPCSRTVSKHDKGDTEEGALETTLISSSEKEFFHELSSNKSSTTSTERTSLTASSSSPSSSSISEDFSDDYFEDHRLGIDDDGSPLYVKRFMSLRDEIEQFILHYSKDMVIKIDIRCSIQDVLEQLEIRMKFINYKYVNEAVPLYPDGIDEKMKEKLSKCKTKEEILCFACQTNPIIPTYFWRKASFMTKCPVKLNQGKITEGHIKFAVRFLGYIHFLSSFSAMKKFIHNPCKYFVCKPNCRIAIVGPRIPSITSVIKSILGCDVYDWKDNLPLGIFHQDIIKIATDWADTVIENIDVPGLDNKYYNKPRGLTNVLEVFQTATEKLLNILTEDIASEENFDPTDMFSDIGLDTEEQDLVELLRTMFHDTERRSRIPESWRATLKSAAEIPFSEIVDTLVNEKFNEIYKSRYSLKLAKEISRWIKQQDREATQNRNAKSKYGRWMLIDVPTDLQFWKYLEKHKTLPDVVIILNEKSPIKLYDFYSRRTAQLQDVHHIANYIINNIPVFFHDAECLLAKTESESHTASKPMNPLEQLLSGVKVDLHSHGSHSLESLEMYLDSKKIINIKQDMQEHTLTTANVAVIQKYFEIFKTKPLIQTEENRKFLTEMNRRFEKTAVSIEKATNNEYLETFKLSLQNIDVSRPEDTVEDETTTDGLNPSVETVDLEEVSRQNLENVKERSIFENIPFGNTKRYCPVTFMNHNSLLHGRAQYMLEYANRYFMMGSQQALEELLNHPFKYVHDCFELVPPPFRACVAGPSVVNRHLYASKLANKMKVTTSTLTSMLREYIEKRDLIQEWMRTSYEDIYEKYCDDFLGNHVARYFKEGFVFESFPTTTKQFEDMLRHNMYPEVIVILDGKIDHIEQNLFNRYKHMLEDKVIWLTSNYSKPKPKEEIITVNFELDEDQDDIIEEGNYEDTGEESIMSDDKLYAEIMAASQNREKTIAQLREKAKNSVKQHIEGIKEVAKLAVEHNIPVIEVPLIVTKKKATALKRAVATLTHMDSRRTMFEQVAVIPLDKAEKVLQSGLCLYSHFKNLDPVDAYNLIPVNMHETMRKQNRLYACMYRRLLYYINGWENLKLFYTNPKMYAKGENPFSVVLPIRMAIFGPPYSGVTTLCKRISKEFDMKVFTKSDVVSLIKTKFPCSSTARNDPETIPQSQLIHEAICAVRNCSANGHIMDIYMDPNDIVTIAKHDAALHLVLVVDVNFEAVWRNWKAEYLRKRPAPYIDTLKELNKMHTMFEEHKKKLEAFTRDMRDIRLFNVFVVNKTNSKWEQWDEARSKIYICLREIGGYFKNLDTGTCFSLSHINVFWYEFKKRLSSLKVFCPVCLRLDRKLKQFRYDYCPVGLKFYERKCQQLFNEPFGYNMESLYQTFVFPPWYIWMDEKKPLYSNNAFRRNLILYREHIYWSCDQHRFDLALHTEQYLPPDHMYLPLYIPFLVSNYFNLNVQYDGNCIVTYHLSQNIVKGSRDFPIYYRGKIFLCASAECAQMFLEQPEPYYNCSGFHADNVQIDWDMKDLAIDFGTLTPELITEALVALNKERPKHYGLNIQDSAAIYVALFLKCANPNSNNDVVKLYEGVMTKYLSECNFIRAQLTKRQIEGNPYIKKIRSPQSTTE